MLVVWGNLSSEYQKTNIDDQMDIVLFAVSLLK